MSYLDLLPKEHRGGHVRRLRATIALLSVLLALFLVAGGIVLMLFDASLREIFDTTQAEISASPKDRAAAIALREANLISGAFDAFHATGDALVMAADVAPEGVRFLQVVLDARSGRMIIEGFASSVQDVIRFRESLDATGKFTTTLTSFSDLRADGSMRFLIESIVGLTHI